METPAIRLRSARLKAGFEHASTAARRFGWPASTLIAHENGQNGLSPEIAEKYATAFGTTPGWLLYGEEPPQPQPETDLDQMVGEIRALPEEQSQQVLTILKATLAVVRANKRR